MKNNGFLIFRDADDKLSAIWRRIGSNVVDGDDNESGVGVSTWPITVVVWSWAKRSIKCSSSHLSFFFFHIFIYIFFSFILFHLSKKIWMNMIALVYYINIISMFRLIIIFYRMNNRGKKKNWHKVRMLLRKNWFLFLSFCHELN